MTRIQKSLCTVHGGRREDTESMSQTPVCVKTGRKKLGVRQAPIWGGPFSQQPGKRGSSPHSFVWPEKKNHGGCHLPKACSVMGSVVVDGGLTPASHIRQPHSPTAIFRYPEPHS